MDKLNGKLSLTTIAPFTLQSTLKSVHVKELNCFVYQPVHFPSFPIFIFCFFLFVTLVPFSSCSSFYLNVLPSSAHFHLAGPRQVDARALTSHSCSRACSRIRFFNQVFALFLSPSSTFVPGVPGYENTYWP